MFLLNWYKEYLEIKHEKAARVRELNYCEACETLKLQLAIANDERKLLIEKLTNTAKPEEPKVDTSELKSILPSRMSWNQRRQILEAEDRQAAKIIEQRKKDLEVSADKSRSGNPLTVSEIEKELGVAN